MKGKKIIATLAVSLGAVSTLVACDEEEILGTQYKIVFMNGDEVVYQTEATEGTYFEVPSTPTAPAGSYFIGWDADGDGTADNITAAKADTTYKALFTPLPEGAKTVTFKNGDDIVGVVLYNEGDTSIVEPQVPTKLGYDGVWEAYELTGDDIIVSATYTPHTYYVNFYADDTLVGQRPFSVESPSISNVPSVPEKDGYTGSWSEYSLSGVYSDVRVDAIYTANPLTIDDFLGVYQMSKDESLTVTPDHITASFWYDDMNKYVTFSFYPEGTSLDGISKTEYFKIEGNRLNLYEIDGEILKSYQIVDGILSPVSDKLEVTTAGIYQYKDENGNVLGTLTISDDGITYVTSDNTVYDKSYTLGDDEIIFIGDKGEITFKLNDKYNYELVIPAEEDSEEETEPTVEEFVKVLPEEYFGLYYYEYTSIPLLTINEANADKIKITKKGLEYHDYTTYSSVTVTLAENGNLVSIDDYGNVTEYAKLTETTIPDKIYGTYRSSYNGTITITSDKLTYTNYSSDEASLLNAIYCEGTDSSGNKFGYLIVGDYSIKITTKDGYPVLNYNYGQFFASTSANLANTTITDSYYGIYSNGDIILEIAANKISYGKDGYSSLVYYVDDSGYIHIFKDKTYTLASEVVVKLDNGKLYVGDVEFSPFNLDLSTIYGTYLNGESTIVVNVSGITYSNTLYTSVSTKGYSIILGNDGSSTTLTYDPDNKTISDGTTTYKYSATLSNNVSEEIYGTYYNEDGQFVIDKTGFYYQSYGDKFACELVVSDNTYTVSYEQYGTTYTYVLTYDSTNKQFTDEDGVVYTLLPEQTIPSNWTSGTYVGYNYNWGETYTVVISDNSITFYEPYGYSDSNFLIISDTKFAIDYYTFTYDATSQTITADIYGLEVTFTLDGNTGGSSDAGGESESLDINMAMLGSWQGTTSYNEIWLVTITDTNIEIYLESYGYQEPYDATILDENSFKAHYTQYIFTYDSLTDTITVTNDMDASYSVTLTRGGK